MRSSQVFLLLMILALFPVTLVSQCPLAPSSAGANKGAFDSWCRSVGGRVAEVGYGSWKCVDCPASSAGTSTIFDGLFWKLLGLDPASQMAAREKAARKAALIAALENERQAAIARQDAEHTRRIEEISRRLQSGDLQLKGLSPETDLQLKLSPTGPIRFGEYMATPATQTTIARLELKTGDEATKSLQTTATTPNASSAGVINPNQPPAFNADQMTKEKREIAEMLSKLTPEEQQRLIAAIKDVDTAATTTATPTQQTAAQPPGPSIELTKKAETLTLKLSTEQKAADDLKAAATSGASPEQLQKQAADDFKNLQQTTLTATPSSGTAPQTGSAAQGLQPATRSSNDASVVDLRDTGSNVVNSPSMTDPRATSAPSVGNRQPEPPAPSTSAATDRSIAELIRRFPAKAIEDLRKLDIVSDTAIPMRKWPGPNNPEAPLSNPIFLKELDDQSQTFRLKNAERITGDAIMGVPLSQRDRQLLVYFFEEKLLVPYDQDPSLAAKADLIIDNAIKEARAFNNELGKRADRVLIEKADALDLRFLPPHGAPNYPANQANPAYTNEAKKIVDEYYRQLDFDRSTAKTRLWVLLMDRLPPLTTDLKK